LSTFATAYLFLEPDHFLLSIILYVAFLFLLLFSFLLFFHFSYAIILLDIKGGIIMPFLAIILVLVALAVFVIAIYNNLVSSRNQVHNAWAQIDVELQRRFDLIPNLIETVKGYMEHERSVLTKVTELRSSWGKATSVSDKAQLEIDLSAALKSIMLVAEQYPELKANTNFLSLQEELSNTESKIASSRSFYNNMVTAYNTKLELFPNTIIARMFNFKLEELFKVANEEVKQNVKVSF